MSFYSQDNEFTLVESQKAAQTNQQAIESLKSLLENSDLFISAVVCMSCYEVSDNVALKDSCAKCGYRYEPKSEYENCPECGSDDYITHCRNCDAEEPEYLDALVGCAWEEYFDPDSDEYDAEAEGELIEKIEKFIEKRKQEKS